MHKPAAQPARRTSTATVPISALARARRLPWAAHSFSSAIAGFALLAGARAFTFTAMLAWREPVLGGAGLVLLAVVGWLRWRVRGWIG